MIKVYVHNERDLAKFVKEYCGRLLMMNIDENGLFFEIPSDDDVQHMVEKLHKRYVIRESKRQETEQKRRDQERELNIKRENGLLGKSMWQLFSEGMSDFKDRFDL